MIAEEILRKIQRIEILSRKAARDLFAGEYHSAFKGRGMEFSQVREYQSGDDSRFIDWNVSSRLGRLYVKQFVEERELTILLALDLSASLRFASSLKSKKEVAAELSALIAFTAMLNNDKVGLLLFSDRIEQYTPPLKGRTHMLRLIRDVIEFQPQGRGTAIGGALAYLTSLIKKKAVVFLISDFLDEGFATALKIASRKHDLIAIDIADRVERALPARGHFLLRDLESQAVFSADFNRPALRRNYAAARGERSLQLQELFRKNGIDFLAIDSSRNYEKPLFDLFLKRRKKFAR
ncbi:MAG: DUF58 domain-containing protein [Acidobacteria bacterium]|jgi:uncharacterized protein (DUF58 family)|nr:DUF58 domain-containing protein [Acidobacteriota bacterium]